MASEASKGRGQSAFVASTAGRGQSIGSTGGAALSSLQARPTAKITAGSRCTIAQDVDVRGNIQIGNETVVHPKAIIHAVHEQGSIVIGARCIVEELAQIVHRGPGQMTIGDQNLFEVGCRVESPRIGSHNTFACKSRTTEDVAIQDFTTVGAGCIAEPPLTWEQPSVDPDSEQGKDGHLYAFPSRSVIFGQQSQVRLWSGNGVKQADALHAKHLDHLRRSEFCFTFAPGEYRLLNRSHQPTDIPEYHKLRIV